MRIPLHLILPLLLFSLLACEKEDVTPQERNFVAEVSVPVSVSVIEEYQIEVTIHKANPCQVVSKIAPDVSGNMINYGFTLESPGTPCIQMTDEETVTVIFEPSQIGQYTLNFLINGEIFETRVVSVTE